MNPGMTSPHAQFAMIHHTVELCNRPPLPANEQNILRIYVSSLGEQQAPQLVEGYHRQTRRYF